MPESIVTENLPSTSANLLGTVLGGDESRSEQGSAHGGYGVYRSWKSQRNIEHWRSSLERGDVVALIPTTASDGYQQSVADRVARFVDTRSGGEREHQGLLALPTSGSTGEPKLVALRAAAISKFLRWGRSHFSFGPGTTSLSLSPWNFDVSLLDTWAVLSAGGSVAAADPLRLHDVDYLRLNLTQHRPTFIQVVPATLDALLKAAGDMTCDSVTDIVLTGGVATQAMRAKAARAFSQATFHNIYGSTEVNDGLIESLTAEQFGELETLALGRPIDGCDVHLETTGRGVVPLEAAEGVTGELLVRTPWMACGYITDAGLNPLPTRGSGLYPSGDQATFSHGRLDYKGRRDRIVKIRGQRVDLDEIEHVARLTKLVGMVVVWVGGTEPEQRLHMAYTAPDHSTGAAAGLNLRLAMSAHLPTHAMPNHFHAFNDPFPQNANGKPDLHAIKKHIGSE